MTSTPSSIADRDIDASSRVPLFVLFVSAAVWLAVGSVFGLIASVKMHSPGLLADCPLMTYGRVHAVAVNAFLYGFAMQAALGVVLWIIARTSATKVSQPWVIAIGAKFWNLGVTVGLLGILIGDTTGFENLEMPRYAAVILFLAFVLIGTYIALTLHLRAERPLQPPQWFLLAALFWFPWIYSTAHLLLTFHPVRGMTQAAVAWWYSANLNLVWFGLVGLGTLFYFLPKLANRQLHSPQLAVFTFWTLVLFASWTGIPSSAPLPAWMPALSTVATVLSISTVLAVILNMRRTLEGRSQWENPTTGKFMTFGLMAFVLSWFMSIINAIPSVNAVTNFTWFNVAQSQLNTYGFFAMIMIGAIYYIVPRVTGMEWPSAKLVRAHYWLAALGIILSVVPLAIGGLLQGSKLLQAPVDFMTLTKSVLPYVRTAMTGEWLIFFGHLLLLVNLLRLSVGYFRTHFLPLYADVTQELKPAEVKP
jgi:cytochrome c oxidase cbb3-type subunit I